MKAELVIKRGGCKTFIAYGGTPCRPQRSRGDRPTRFCNYFKIFSFMILCAMLYGCCPNDGNAMFYVYVNSFSIPVTTNDFYVSCSNLSIKFERNTHLDSLDIPLEVIFNDIENFRFWIKESANKGCKAAIVTLAEAYEYGYLGFPMDLCQAHSLRRIISKENADEHWACCAGVGEFIENAYILQQEYLKARTDLRLDRNTKD